MIATRERNPERSRERILAAALHEFAAVGFAGARVASIAERAGLNKQLISHHFGGKRGLYRAVMNRRRRAGGAEMAVEPGAMPGALARFYERAATDPEWIRVLLWEALDEDEDGITPQDERRGRYAERVGWVREEQAAGRLPGSADPELLLLSLLGAALYPVLLPQVCEVMTGTRPDDPAFVDRYRDHLRSLAHHLAR